MLGLSLAEETSINSLQSLIDNAKDGDVVQVPAGTYTENILIDKNLTLQGADENKTIIDGNKTGSAITIGFYHPAYVKLSKLTIKNGSAHEGGGIYIDRDCNVTAEDCCIQRNMALHSGGGVCVERDSAFKLIGTKIFLNYADFGGGIYTDGTVDLGTGEVYHNFASPHTGGGIYSDLHGKLSRNSAKAIHENTPEDVNSPCHCEYCCCRDPKNGAIIATTCYYTCSSIDCIEACPTGTTIVKGPNRCLSPCEPRKDPC